MPDGFGTLLSASKRQDARGGNAPYNTPFVGQN
jgi:hypothetical protein